MLKTRLNRFFFSIPLMLSSVAASAQEKLVASLENQPLHELDPSSWLWVGGAAVFIFLLVVVLRIGTRRADM